MSPLRKRMMEELQLRNLSPITADTYIRAVERFARYFDQSPARLGSEQVRQYLLHLLQEKNVVANTLLVNRSALRFLYVVILKQKWFDEEIPRPKRRPTLPGILSAEEVTRILDHTHNLKHWTILATFYATALRANELKHLKVSDIPVWSQYSGSPAGRWQLTDLVLQSSLGTVVLLGYSSRGKVTA